MVPGEREWDELIAGLREGETTAIADFVRLYHPALQRVAAKAIAPGMQRRFGAESIAQSVCRTFVRRAKEGSYEFSGGGGLWALLCAIALSKVRERVRFHRREKRQVDREIRMDNVSGSRAEFIARAPTPEESAVFAEELEQIFAACDERERRVVEMRLADHTQEEIAAELGCTERTVRRVLSRLEARLRGPD